MTESNRVAPPRGDQGMGKVARGSAINLIGAAVAALCTFLLTVVIARGMNRTEAGVLFSTTSLFLLATSVGQLGTDTGLVYFLSRCRALGRVDLIRSYLRSATRPVLITGIAMSVVFFVLAPTLARWTNPEHIPTATSYLRVLAVFIPLAGLENVGLAATRGLGSMRPNAFIEQFGRPSLQLLLVAAAIALPAPHLIGSAWAVAYAPAAALAWLWWRKLRNRLDPAMRPPFPGVAGQFWRFTAPRSLASVAQILMQRLDIVLVGALSGAADAAIYAAATRFIVAGQMGRSAVSLAVQPALAEAIAHRDHRRAQQLFQTSTAWLTLVTWPLFLVFAVLGDAVLRVFGSGYGTGSDVLLILSLSMLIATGVGDVDTVLIMAGKTSWSLANMAVALVVNLGLDLWLIPGHGVLGAAIGWAAAIVTKNMSAFVQVALSLKLQPFAAAALTSIAITVFSFGVIPTFMRLGFGTSWPALVSALLAGGSSYLVALWRFRRVLEIDALRTVRRGGRLG